MKERWLSEIEAIGRDARAVLDGLTSEDANRQPAAGRWSVAQNLSHITKTAVPYLELIQAQLDGHRAEKPCRAGLLAHFLARSMEPPPRIRVKTLRRLEPEETLDVDAVMAEFDAVHERLAALIRASDEDDFRRGRFASPYMSIIRVRLDQAVETLLAHARRHLWQARQVRRALGVPG